MSLKWAQKEVDAAIRRELKAEQEEAEKEGRPFDENDFHYGVECYKSALRAYESLCKDGHSGMSWSFTRKILTKLINDIPLSPILGTDDEWSNQFPGDEQNVRRSSLFRHKNEDGTYRYHDVDRVMCVEDMGDHKIYSHYGMVSQIIDELHPIVMPYVPTENPITVQIKMFDSVHAELGSYDTLAVLDYIIPGDPEKKSINKFFKEVGTEMVEIGFTEYNERYLRFLEADRVEKEKIKLKIDQGSAP